MRVIQFHPSLSYEDFVRGWRPDGNGQLKLIDGVFLQAISAARAESDLPFVVIVEEINRGNPAQTFGEMLTLLEHDKRREEEAIELAYQSQAGRTRVHSRQPLCHRYDEHRRPIPRARRLGSATAVSHSSL